MNQPRNSDNPFIERAINGPHRASNRRRVRFAEPSQTPNHSGKGAHSKAPRHPTLRPPQLQPQQRPRQRPILRQTRAAAMASSAAPQPRQGPRQATDDIGKRIRVYEWTMKQMESAAQAARKRVRAEASEEMFLLKLSVWRSAARLRNIRGKNEDDDREEWNQFFEKEEKVYEPHQGLARIMMLDAGKPGVWERVRLSNPMSLSGPFVFST